MEGFGADLLGFGADLFNPDPAEVLQCDYLVIGAGTRGMCFVDGLLTFNKTCTVFIVDERDAPGGHWHDAPSFFKVSQISLLYGCPSRQLDSGRERKPGEPCERASKAQVISYYDSVMEDFLRTGRVRFFHSCTANWDGTSIVSTVCGRWDVKVRCKVVDTTFGPCELPSSSFHKMPFKVHPGALVVSPLGITSSGTVQTAYVIIGAGRVGVDTILHLLDLGVPPDHLHWVVPRDYWTINRELLYPENFGELYMRFESRMLEEKYLHRFYTSLEKEKAVFRLDPAIFPIGFHLCYISPQEHSKLLRLKNIIRMGYVREINETHLVLDEGMYTTGKGTLHVDCTSSSVRTQPQPVHIWSGNRITMQLVQEVACGYGELNTSLSAAVIGYLEGTCQNGDTNNERCHPMRYPDTIWDWELIHHAHYSKVDRLLQDKKVTWKLLRTRPSVLATLTGDELGRFSNMRDKRIKQSFSSRKEFSMALANCAMDLYKQGRCFSPSPVRPFDLYIAKFANASTQTDPEDEQ